MSLSVSLQHQFDSISLDIGFEVQGGVTALFGASGAGKTTVINAVAGLLHPTRGRISLQGEVLLDTDAGINVPVHQRQLGYVFQDARLFPHMSVAQNLRYGRRMRRINHDPQAEAHVVDMLGIGHLMDRQPSNLSGGEKQRVAIGRALLSAPRLLLMDEPLASLDETRRSEILPYLERLRDEATVPVLYVSHSMAEVARLATHIVVLSGGQVAHAGTAEEVLSNPHAVPALGIRHAGAVLTAQVTKHEDDGLTQLGAAGGQLYLPQIRAQIGAKVRVRIRAQDVILATEIPKGTSALNILQGEIQDMHDGQGPGVVVALSCGNERILSRITRRSAQALQLRKGMKIYAILKTVSVAHGDIGGVPKT
jgi:molybdate transport system ATP-binding protein